jgi:N-acetylmuramoyl-L-alanine amidase
MFLQKKQSFAAHTALNSIANGISPDRRFPGRGNKTMHKQCYVMIQIFCWAIALLFFLQNSVCAATNELSAIRSWSSPTSTRIVLDIKQRATYQTPLPPRPELLIIDLIDFFGPIPVSTVTVNDGIVKTVTAARTDQRTIRITIALEKPAASKIFQMERYLDMPPRLAIDFIRQDLEQADQRYREETRKLKKKELRIVVLDPGHGGDDPGAISAHGIREKNIVLSVARKTARKLNNKPGVKAYLTRKGDYFIPLSTRTRIAREYGADLFASIHADSNPSRELQGTSVYCLSLKGASDNTAEMLAQKENASDSIGGVPLDHNNSDLNAIIIDLVQTHTFNASMRCADILLKEVSKVNAVLRDRPQHAGFKVLRDPDIPSLLIETDFLSNPKKEKQLRTEEFQNRIADAIAAAIMRYLAEIKPLSTPDRSPIKAIADKNSARQDKKSARYHTVKKGETLDSIAQRYNTTADTLRRLNGLSSESTVAAGKKLKVKPGE